MMKKRGKETKKKRFVHPRRRPKRDDRQELETRLEQLSVDALKSFAELPASRATLQGLSDSELSVPTAIQRESLPIALRGRDVLGAAKTGSGKTVAFLVPMLELLHKLRWSKIDGLGAMVITPTRELALQIFEQLNKVGRHHDFSAGLVIGGKDLHFETSRLVHCNIIICTPGRILQHMDENPDFDTSNLKLLVLDEADRILEMGFAAQMNAIIDNLPKQRQTLLFSATQTRSVKDLARLSLKDPVYVSVHEHATKATPDQLVEHYCVCSPESKLDMLWSFIKSHRRKKLLIFVQSCKQAKYLNELLHKLRVPIQLSALYGSLNQLRRMAIYQDFCQKKQGALIATDIAARGLDFPCVDWVLQLDCPEDWKAYNHRVGRTARNELPGNALLLLTPAEEEAMVKQLRAHKFPVEKIEVNPEKLYSVERKVAAHVASDVELKASAQRCFLAYLKSVFLMRDKSVFDVTTIDTEKYAKSLGLLIPPRVRFLQRHLKNKETSKGAKDKKDSNDYMDSDDNEQSKEYGNEEGNELNAFDTNDDDDEDMLTVKRADHELMESTSNVILDEEVSSVPQKSSKKVTTRVAAVKRALAKKSATNVKIKFDEEGDASEMVDGGFGKASSVGKQYDLTEDNGFDLEAAKRMLRAEDVFDKAAEKERIRERKRKEKELKKRPKAIDKDEKEDSDEDDEEANLDWLPDPDRVYGKDDSNISDEQSGHDNGDDDEITAKTKKRWKPPKKKRKTNDFDEALTKKSKKKSVDELASLEDAEALALKLLS